MNRKNAWVLDSREVSYGFRGSATGRRKRASQSRELDVREGRVIVTHVPTGIEVSATIPEGHYSRTAMTKLRAEIEQRLFVELEAQVAKALRIPGR